MRYTAILKGLHNAIALDFDFKKGWIYWSDVSMDVICRSRINGSEKSGMCRVNVTERDVPLQHNNVGRLANF